MSQIDKWTSSTEEDDLDLELEPTEHSRLLLFCINFVVDLSRQMVKKLSIVDNYDVEAQHRLNKQLLLLNTWFEYLCYLEQSQQIEKSDQEKLVYISCCIFDLVVSDDITSKSVDKPMPYLPYNSVYSRTNNNEFLGYICDIPIMYGQILPLNEIQMLLKHTQDKLRATVISPEQFDLASLRKTDKRVQIINGLITVQEFRSLMEPLIKNGIAISNKKAEKYIFFGVSVDDTTGIIFKLDLIPTMNGFNLRVQDMKAHLSQLAQYADNNHISPIPRSEAVNIFIQTQAEIEDEPDLNELCEEMSNIKDTVNSQYEIEQDNHINKSYDFELFVRELIEYNKDIFDEPWKVHQLFLDITKHARIRGLPIEERNVEYLRISNKLQVHYERLFSRLHNGTVQSPEIILTRSGISANGMAMQLAERCIKILNNEQSPKYSMLPGWYFENIPPDSWKKAKVEHADILLCNIQTNPPLINQEPEEYYSGVKNEIKRFIQNAENNPNRFYFVIIDKTADLLNTDYINSSFPSNIILLESSSLTKHARGVRNRFFGVVACWGITHLENKLQQHGIDYEHDIYMPALEKAVAAVTPAVLTSYPKIKREEIEDNLEQQKILYNLFQETVATEQEMRNVPLNRRIEIQLHNYFCFILSVDKTDASLGYLDSVSGLNFSKKVQDTLKSLPDYVKSHFEMGDSFGLNTTRISSIDTFLSNNKKTNIHRISFGRKTPPEAVVIFAKTLIQKMYG